MTKDIILFDRQTQDGSSPLFRTNLNVIRGTTAILPELLLYGNLDGANLLLYVQNCREEFIEVEEKGAILQASFPLNNKASIINFNYNSRFIFRIDIDNAGINTNISIETRNCLGI